MSNYLDAMDDGSLGRCLNSTYRTVAVAMMIVIAAATTTVVIDHAGS